MQFRHLRYFVKIVEAGSFSRAAATIHVAQPALSQQIAELEARLGVTLLQRSARGVRPTAAGELLFRKAMSILQQVEQLPSIVRSSEGAVEGAVSLGMSSTLAAAFAGTFIERCKTALPKVTLKFSVMDSQSIRAKVEGHSLDVAVVFEDELVPIFSRTPLFRQRLYLISREAPFKKAASVSFEQLARIPLILPSPANVTRRMIDRAFAAVGATPNIVAEADVLSSILAAVRAGVGSTIIPKGDTSDISGDELAKPLLIEPPLFLTASIIFALSVREFLQASGAEPASGLASRLASALISCAHGVIALPLGTPTMKLPDVRMTGRLVISNMVDAWSAKLAAARAEKSWPRISLSTFS
jgi:LysR family transcriptional regulator, nitrogen assimilation regulatory protein